MHLAGPYKRLYRIEAWVPKIRITHIQSLTVLISVKEEQKKTKANQEPKRTGAGVEPKGFGP